MKYLQIILYLVLSVSLSFVHAGEMRNWTGSNGKVIEAEFISFDSDKEIVRIRLKDGREQNVRIDLFSKKDQDFVRNQGKTDNPFGETKFDDTPKAPSKPIDMKFVMDEAKKALEQFEKANQKQLGMGHLPCVYADYALIQHHAGQQEEAKKSLETAVKLAESDSDISYKTRAKEGYNYNYARIARIAIEIGCPEIAKKMIAMTKKECGDDSMLAGSYVLVGKDADAMLSVAKRGNNIAKASGFNDIGAAYLKLGNVEKAKEMFETADSMGNDWCRHWIAGHWIKSGNIDEAKKYIDKISEDRVKSYALRNLALSSVKTRSDSIFNRFS